MTTALRAADRVAVPAPRSASGAWFVRFFQTLTIGYPVLWAIGIGGLYWVFLGFAGIAYLVSQRFIGRAAIPLVGVVVALLASVPIGVLAFGLDFSRIASFFGNILVWLGLIALITAARRHDVVRPAIRGVLVIGIAQGAVTLLAQLAYPTTLPVPLLQNLADRLPTGLGAFAINALYTEDWLGELAFRSAGMMAQPTWAGATGALTVTLGIYTVVTARGGWRLLGVLAIAMGAYSVDLSLSRSTEIALAVSLLVALVVSVRRFSTTLFAVLGAIGVALLAIVLIGWGGQVASIVVDINDQREGSLGSRSAIYARTFGFVQQLPVPLLGYGIKPKEDGLVASVATHSTYLGLLFRSGVLGLLALFVFFAIVLVLAVRASNGWAAAIAVFTIIWCTLEDFDPGHLVPLGIVIAYGLAVNPPLRSPRLQQLQSTVSARPLRASAR
jgi:O-antigen ligase